MEFGNTHRDLPLGRICSTIKYRRYGTLVARVPVQGKGEVADSEKIERVSATSPRLPSSSTLNIPA